MSITKNNVIAIAILLLLNKVGSNLMYWKEQLDKQGFVQFKKFLPNELANQLRKQIITNSHFKAWGLLTTPYQPLTRIKDKITSGQLDKCRHKQATLAFKRGEFSFSFYRSNNTHNKQHQSDNIHKFFANKVVEHVCEPLGLSGELRDTFLASYIKNQFLTYHTDGSAGQYAFIYQLSKGWQNKYGGQLEIYPRKIKFYKKCFEPTFNCLTLLKLAHPMPHSVRLLNNPPHKHRITISGWLE